MTAKHTQLPWRIEHVSVGEVVVASKNKIIVDKINQNDAALIVKAVNSHEALLEALKEILLVHANDNIRPKAFYIASNALKLAGEE